MSRYIDAENLREVWLENGLNERVYNTKGNRRIAWLEKRVKELEQ